MKIEIDDTLRYCYVCGKKHYAFENRTLDIFECVNLGLGKGSVSDLYTICPECRVNLLKHIQQERKHNGLATYRVEI